jgi:hypothetical protein
MKQIHGIPDARRIGTKNEDLQEVLVEDENGRVVLKVGSLGYAAGLSPEQAIYISKLLAEAARRVTKEAMENDA